MSKLVTIYGGSGFVGRYIARRMAKEGWRVRVAVRRPNEAMFVKPYGVVGQVEPILCNIRDDASVAAAMAGADAVINCVGILAEAGKNKFDTVQAEGAELSAADTIDRQRSLQECAGVLPLAQLREPYSAVRLIAEHLPVERLYGLRLPADEEVL